MDEKKLRKILETMNGITYLAWKKLEMSIEKQFKSEASNQANKMQIASPEEIVANYKIDFGLPY